MRRRLLYGFVLFTSRLAQTVPQEPPSKQDCMNGGSAQVGFKNEGQCIT